jgi:hypothetical protein
MSNKKEIRLKIWLKNPTCYVCKKIILQFHHASTEHVVPKSYGGSNKQRNLSISHRGCNHKRGNILCPVVFRHKLINTSSINQTNNYKPELSELPESDFKKSVRAWRIKLRQDYLDWISTNLVQE